MADKRSDRILGDERKSVEKGASGGRNEFADFVYVSATF